MEKERSLQYVGYISVFRAIGYGGMNKDLLNYKGSRGNLLKLNHCFGISLNQRYLNLLDYYYTILLLIYDNHWV